MHISPFHKNDLFFTQLDTEKKVSSTGVKCESSDHHKAMQTA
jgi:hypothetical protein